MTKVSQYGIHEKYTKDYLKRVTPHLIDGHHAHNQSTKQELRSVCWCSQHRPNWNLHQCMSFYLRHGATHISGPRPGPFIRNTYEKKTTRRFSTFSHRGTYLQEAARRASLSVRKDGALRLEAVGVGAEDLAEVEALVGAEVWKHEKKCFAHNRCVV